MMAKFGEYEQVPSIMTNRTDAPTQAQPFDERRMEWETVDDLLLNIVRDVDGNWEILPSWITEFKAKLAKHGLEICAVAADADAHDEIADLKAELTRTVDAWGDQVVSLDEAHAAEIAKYEAVIAQAREALEAALSGLQPCIDETELTDALAAIAALEVKS